MLAGLAVPPLATAFGWQTALGCVGSLSLVLLLLLQLSRSQWDDDCDPNAPLSDNPLRGLKAVWAAPTLRWLSLTAACFAAIQLCLTTFMVTMLVEELGFSIVAAGLTVALSQAAGMVGRVVLGWTSDRLGASRVLVALGIAVTAASLTTSMLSRVWDAQVVSAVLACYGFTSLSWTGIYLAQVASHSPPGRVGATTGGSMFFNFVGIAVGPALIAGSYAVLHDYTTSFAALALVGVAGTATAYLAAASGKAA
jgi:predicted MFS family arabinose efflux permease